MLVEILTRRKPTSEIFSDGLNLRNWVASAFPNNVWDILDSSLKQEANSGGPIELNRFENCCINVLEIGILCTEENPQKRCPMPEVVLRLEHVLKEMTREAEGFLQKS